MTFSGLVRNAHFYPTSYWQVLCRSFLSLCHALVKSRIFLFYPMSCLPRVVRPPFGVMLWQKRAVSPSSSLRGLGKLPARNMPMFRVPLLYRHCEAWKSRISQKLKPKQSIISIWIIIWRERGCSRLKHFIMQKAPSGALRLFLLFFKIEDFFQIFVGVYPFLYHLPIDRTGV